MMTDRRVLHRVLPTAVLLIVVIAAFVQFIWENDRRIVTQNTSYVEDATAQTASQISELLESAQGSINIIAQMYGQTMTSPEVDFEILNELAMNAPFEDIEFVNAEGIVINSEGRTADVSDREYYIDGMKGNSGMDDVFEARTANGNMIVFYAPLEYQGEIIGVLTARYLEEELQQSLATTFFGEKTDAFLCLEDGSILACSADDAFPDNILDYFDDERLVDIKAEELREIFSEGGAASFQYAGKQGTGSACVVRLPEKEWLILQNFPSAITYKMVSNANSAGIALEIELITAFVAYIVILLLINLSQKKKLLVENKEMTQVISGITQIFDRFVLVDFERNRYKYVGGTSSSFVDVIPLEGNYDRMVEGLLGMMPREDDKVRMGRMLQREYIQSHLKRNMNLRYEYQVAGEELSWVNLNIINLHPTDERPTRILFTRQDVTGAKHEELRAHTALREALQAAEDASHAKSDFLSRMSHDIRTPMNAIMGMTTIAAMHVKEPDRVKDCLDKINMSGRHLLRLINEVLDMAKIESGKVSLPEENFNLAEVTDEMLAMTQTQINAKGQSLTVDVDTLIHENVIGDRQRLEQVLVNIMGNAIKFTPEGGKIYFGIREKESQFEGSSCYEFVFEDNGIGMEEEFLDRVFEPFARAGDSRVGQVEGTGLGMAIARNIVQMMHGDIQVESSIGKGSRFTVNIYLKQNEKENLAELHDLPVEGLQASEQYAGKRVLLVEDNELNMEIAEELLLSVGLDVELAWDGKEAVERIKGASEGWYDMVFMDIQMPNMNGYEATSAIRELERRDVKELPIVAMTADAFQEDMQKAVVAGMNAHLAKPIEIAKLERILETYFEG